MPRHKNRKNKSKKRTRKMRGGDVTMAPEQSQPQPVSSTPSWFSNFATRIKSAASNLTAKLRNIKWSGTIPENPTPPTVQQQEPMAQQPQQPQANNLFQNTGEKIQDGFNSTTKKLEEGYEKTKNTVGDFFNKDVGAGIGEPEVESDNQNGGRKPRKITKKRRMRGGFAAYNEYTVAQTASPVEGIKTAEPTYMNNASLTNSLNGGKKRKTKRKRHSKGRKTRGKKH